MNSEQIREIIHKYNQGEASPRERTLLENWYYQEGKKTSLKGEDFLFVLQKEIIWSGTLHRSGLAVAKTRRLRWLPYAAGAVLCLLLSVVFIVYQSDRKQISQQRISLQIGRASCRERGEIEVCSAASENY